MNRIEITNETDERIKHYKSMRDNLIDSAGNSLFVAESEKVVSKLLKSDIEIVSILARRDFYEEHKELIVSNVNNNKNLYTADLEILKKIIGFKMHTGVIAIAKKPNFTPLSKLSDTIVCLNGLVDSENIGSIVRNCVAFGVDSLIYDVGSSSPYLRRAVRVSIGTIFNLKIYRSDDIARDLDLLKSNDYKIISAEINENSKSIFQYTYPSKKVIVFGNEAQGISKEILSISDVIIHIPISEEIESLNVASSTAIFLSRLMI